jgi:alpha-N-arabinofuranosidase
LTLADERATNGDKQPFNVRYWGVGNESWGCGGTMRPQEYATLYRKWITQFPNYVEPFLVATGPRGHSADSDIGWTTGFFENMRGYQPPDGFSVHYYTDLRPTPIKAADFNAAEWYEVLLRGVRLERILLDHWAEMGKFDPTHRTKFVVDEWGVWYKPGEEIAPSYILSSPITLRDAIHTGLTFDIFNRHAEKIAMANVAQTVNCIHSLFLAEGDKFVRTPAYYVFEMYRGHMGGRQLPVQNPAKDLIVTALAGPATLPGLSASASIRENRLTLTITNPSLEATFPVRVRLANGIHAREAQGVILTHDDMRAANTFSKPDEVKPAPYPVKAEGSTLVLTMPKQSVVSIQCQVG